MRWAVVSWHVLAARAAVDGVTARPGAPRSLLDLDSVEFLAYVEGVLRESPDQGKALDGLYRDAVRPVSSSDRRANRNAEIARVIQLFS